MKLSNILASAALATTAVYSYPADQQPLVNEHEEALSSHLISLHRDLVEIDSVSYNEYEVHDFVKKYLESRNFTVESQDARDGRKNIYAYPGTNRNTKILVTSHYDTVPPYFPYRVEGDRIYGRGAVDAKASIASQIVAVEELLKKGKIGEGDVGLLYVVDEEKYGEGMKYAHDHLGVDSWETVIFGEPTENKLGIGHKGIFMANLVAHGVASHSGYPELGRNANDILIKALYQLLNTELPTSELLGDSTLNIGKITGGVAGNVIPEHADALVVVRIAAEPEKVADIFYDLVNSTEHLTIENIYHVDPQYLDYDVPGFDTVICKYSTDIPNLPGNFTRYLYGPGSIFQAHATTEEWITYKDLAQGVRGVKKLISMSL